MHKLFVYGTLKKGKGNHGYIGGSSVVSRRTFVEGYQMYSLGGFPGVVKDDSSLIYGEVYSIDNKTLEGCDYLEGYRADKPDNSMYIRTTVDCFDDNQRPIKAYMYIWNGPVDGLSKVDNGEW